MSLRYSYGGDEFIFVEISEEMALESFFKGFAITHSLAEKNINGIVDICPANASYQIRYDPDVIAAVDLIALLKDINLEVTNHKKELATRIIEIPVFYNDPWTNEVSNKFKERRQDPEVADLEYSARINGFNNIDEFITAHSHSPWFVSMVGFVAGLPFLYQMVPKEKQLEAPKYVRPRTDTPKLTIGHGGCFSCIYSVRGAGGYQMFGITPAPIFDPKQKLNYFKDMMVFFRPGDIVKFKPISKDEYDLALEQVEEGVFDLLIKEVLFDMDIFIKDPSAYNQKLLEKLR